MNSNQRQHKLRMASSGIELRVAEAINSIYLAGMTSLEHRDETKAITGEQSYNATYKITRVELSQLDDFLDGLDRRMFRKKQRSLADYVKQARSWLGSFGADLEDDEAELERFCRGFVRIIKDMHSIMHEDTRQKLRDRIVEATLDETAGAYFDGNTTEH